MLYSFVFLLFPILISPSFTLAACYSPNGVREPNTAYQPCINVEGIHSMCCALNRTLVGGTADRCQQNGLCIGADGSSWRGFCTDRNWNSPGCLSREICNDDTGGTSSNSNELTKCQDGTYCCGKDSTSCCSQGKGFTLNPTLISIQTVTSTSSSIGSSTSTTSSSTSSASAACIPSDNNTSDSLKSEAITKGTNATIVGVGVGVPLAVLAVAGSILSFWLGQKRGRRTHSALDGSGKEELSSGVGGGVGEDPYRDEGVKLSGNFIDGYYAPPAPAGEGRRVELRGTAVAAELGGDARR